MVVLGKEKVFECKRNRITKGLNKCFWQENMSFVLLFFIENKISPFFKYMCSYNIFLFDLVSYKHIKGRVWIALLVKCTYHFKDVCWISDPTSAWAFWALLFILEILMSLLVRCKRTNTLKLAYTCLKKSAKVYCSIKLGSHLYGVFWKRPHNKLISYYSFIKFFF